MPKTADTYKFSALSILIIINQHNSGFSSTCMFGLSGRVLKKFGLVYYSF